MTPARTRAPASTEAPTSTLHTRFASKRHLRTALQYGGYWLFTTLAIFVIFRNWAYDDPFITYRYAQNLAHGLGFVYNPGERILSTTTPLFALLLAIPAAVYHDLPRVANLISAASIALGGLFLWDLGRALNSRMAAWAGLLLYPTFMLTAMTTGSETPLYLAFCLAAFAAFARQRYALAAAASALAVLTRPDGILVPVILALAYLPELRRRPLVLKRPLVPERPIPWRAVLVFLTMLLPWYLFAWGYFGSPLPATLAAKQEQARMLNSLTFTPGFLNVLKWFQHNPVYWLEALLALSGAAWMARKARRWWLLLAWPVIYFLGYHFLQVSTYYWYYAPLVPPLLAACGLGIDGIIQTFQTRWVQWAAVGVLAIFSAAQFSDLWNLHQNPDQRVLIYRQTGRWLAEHTPAGATVATIEIGIIGYYAQRYMIDFAGLLQPDIAAQLASSANYDRLAAQVSEQYQPNFLVVREGSFTELESSYIADRCQLAHKIQGQSYGYPGAILIYDCR
jgi:hypothetical protein